MKFFGLTAGVLCAAVLIALIQKVSADALALGVGLLFGILAGVPAMMISVANRRPAETPRRQEPPQPQPPVIILAGPDYERALLADQQRQERAWIDDGAIDGTPYHGRRVR